MNQFTSKNGVFRFNTLVVNQILGCIISKHMNYILNVVFLAQAIPHQSGKKGQEVFEYINIVVFTGLIISILTALVLIAPKLAPKKPNPDKLDTYECGVPLLGASRDRFPIHFFPVAIMFILFDIETVFLVPWAVIYKNLGTAGLVSMLVFIGILFWGLAYILKERILDW